MKKLLLTFALFIMIVSTVFALYACDENTSQVGNDSSAVIEGSSIGETEALIRLVYDSYVVFAEGNNETPLSYEAWLSSIKGADGKTPTVEINADGFWVINGSVTEYKAVGEKGDKGANGKSAYELAVENGYTGTLTEWLASLIGETGKTGATGANGKSAYELAVENGYTGTLTEWLASLIGETGKTGATGANGKSAYELAVENGYTGTLTEWLASLIGETGKTGATGANGKSAYELAVENGYTGTLTEWLASLVGDKGEKGEEGKEGAQGVGIKSIVFDDDGNLVITYTDETVQSIAMPAHEHFYGEWMTDIENSCVSVGISHRICNVCGKTEYLFEEAFGHTLDEGVTIVAPTCTEYGLIAHVCEICGETVMERVDPIGHDYRFDSFVWDSYTARAKYVCLHADGHIEYHDAVVTNETTTHATCTTSGVRTYTASYDGHTDHKTETLAALGHIDTNGDGVCDRCGSIENRTYVRVDGSGNASETGKYILFGEYPQTVKASDVTVTNTTDDRGYYLGSDGAYYAKITAYPYTSGYTFTTGTTIMSGTEYYFKVEPIKWFILEESDGTATLLCNMIIDAHRYDDSSNNYQESEIRAWLINDFYNTAFNSLQQQMINVVEVNNSARSTNPDGNATQWNDEANQYACENTFDKVWLISEQEVTKAWQNVTYASDSTKDTARIKKATDYAKSQGAYIPSYQDPNVNNNDNGLWWLRSPYYNESARVCVVANDGRAYGIHFVFDRDDGVVPALQITL